MRALNFNQIKNGDIVVWKHDYEVIFDKYRYKRKIIDKLKKSLSGSICWMQMYNSNGEITKEFTFLSTNMKNKQFLLMSRKQNDDDDMALDFL